MKRIFNKTCSHCGTEFETTGPRVMFCSLDCSLEDKLGKEDANGCIPWLGTRNKYGNSYMTYDGNCFSVVRMLFEQDIGRTLSEKEQVVNQCGNIGCCNINHYKIGTSQDIADLRDKRGRQPRGERNWNAVLTNDIVRKIKFSKLSGTKLAEKYGLPRATISNIRLGYGWKHVTK